MQDICCKLSRIKALRHPFCGPTSRVALSGHQMIRRMAIICVFSILLGLPAALQSQVAAPNPADWVVGDVFVGTGNGNYQVWHSANPTASNPSYTPLQTINDGTGNGGTTNGGATAGCGFDLAYRFFGTNLDNTLVDRYSVDNGHPLVQQIPSFGGVSRHAESIAFDAAKSLYIGFADSGSAFGGGQIERWEKDVDSTSATFGKYKNTGSFQVPVENRGADWIDLASDGQTIFYTSEGRHILEFNVNTQVSSLYADLGQPGLPNFTLFAIRILPPGDGSGGVLVADKKNIKQVAASGTVVKTYDAAGEDDWEALSLDPNGTSFWAGNATTHHFYRFNITTGAIEVGPLNTTSVDPNATLGGICVDGGFNAAQSNNLQIFAETIPLNQNSKTFTFTSPFTFTTFTATLPDLSTSVTATVRTSLVDTSIALSDPTVFSFNPGNTVVTSFAGSIPCDTTLTAANAFPNKCEVFEFEANPNAGFSTTNVIIDKNPTIFESQPNLRLLRNLDEDITDMVIDYPAGGTRKCVFTINQQTFTNGARSCGFSSPAQNQNFVKNSTSSIAFKFQAVQPGGDCKKGPFLTDGMIQPLLMITQLVPRAAPNSIPVIVAGKSGGPPTFVFSGGTWQLQVKTSDMPAGFNYVATVIDLKSVIPSFSVTFSLK